MAPSRASLYYQPALFVLSGAAVAYGIYRLSHNLSTSRTTTTLHRSNAIRRPGSRGGVRGRGALRALNEEEAQDLIARLRSRENAQNDYGGGFFQRGDPQPAEGTGNYGFTYRYLPSQLPSEDTFVQAGFPAAAAHRLVFLAQLRFLNAFMEAELPFGSQGPTGAYIVPRAAQYMVDEFTAMGILPGAAQIAIQWFNNSDIAQTSLRDYYGATLRQEDGPGDPEVPARGADEVTENQSDHVGHVGAENEDLSTNGQEMLTLLYHIAEDNSRKSHYIHRGVQCNGCGRMPIQGTRYRCSNCSDFDLCERCESQQVHTRTHVFYKIRIPTPWNNGPRQAQPVWYPGKPTQLQRALPEHLTELLARQHDFESSHIQAMWDQFRVIAATEWDQDPDGVGLAIDRATFNKAFLPSTGSRPPPPNLIFDRIFHFYDLNDDGLIGFSEFVGVQACLDNKTRNAKLKRIFNGYDLNGDGYVDRKDFLRMFRAWYILKREFMRDIIINMEDESNITDIREIVLGTQPISAAFLGTIHPGHDSRAGEGKAIQDDDLSVVDNSGPLREDGVDTLDRSAMISEVEQKRRERLNYIGDNATLQDKILASFKRNAPGELQTLIHHLKWPPPGGIVNEEDVKTALGAVVALEEIMDPVDRSRVVWAMANRLDQEEEEKIKQAGVQAVHDRWLKRRFYTDVEEGATRPPGYTESDSSDDDDDDSDGMGVEGDSFSGSRPISPRSRSSSKVRFEDSITDTDYETRSNTSSRSIPVGERWGGFEISEQEKDVGSEILYQAVYEGFNELLDQVFKKREEKVIRADGSRKLREYYKEELEGFEAAGNDNSLENQPRKSKVLDSELEKLLNDSGYTVDTSILRPTAPRRVTDESEDAVLEDINQRLQSGTADPPIERTEDTSDPTLPQNRPNSPSVALLISQSETDLDDKDRSTSSKPHVIRARPSPAVLHRWAEDKRTDAETKERGGPARIKYLEFERYITPDSKASDGLGEGGINKLGFVGSWIDMWLMGPLELSRLDNRRFGFLAVDPMSDANRMMEALGEPG